MFANELMHPIIFQIETERIHPHFYCSPKLLLINRVICHVPDIFACSVLVCAFVFNPLLDEKTTLQMHSSSKCTSFVLLFLISSRVAISADMLFRSLFSTWGPRRFYQVMTPF